VFSRAGCEQAVAVVRAAGIRLTSRDERHQIRQVADRHLEALSAEHRPVLGADAWLDGLEAGVAAHHAGLVPPMKEAVEEAFAAGLLKVVFATETLSLGINMPARTVVIEKLSKFTGEHHEMLTAGEYTQLAGRAGRRGIDEVGYVYSVVEWPHSRAVEIERVIQGAIEPIRSQFNLSYATLLMLWERLGNKIYTAAEKSFANFMAQKSGQRDFRSKLGQIKRKLSVLRSMNYIRDDKLTAKGKFAKQIQGYELQVTELLFRGVLNHLSEEELCMVFHAIVYEAKKADWARRVDHGRFKWIRKTCWDATEAIQRVEDAQDLEDRVKPMEFKLASAVLAWAKGATWADLEAHTGASDGDLVRFFRLALQLLRNTMYALEKHDPLRDALHGAARRLNRDVVDAERQLRLGTQDLSIQGTPRSGPPPLGSAPPPSAPEELSDGA
ncbi:MAG TPA: helicase-related protein, partial [Planctomycetota bacterium]|nr:helicase-related protein [Planctomycetota bacterium]